MKRFAMALASLFLAVFVMVRPAHALTEAELMVERARLTAMTLLSPMLGSSSIRPIRSRPARWRTGHGGQ
mgnify:CR=1 FL=1